MSISELGALGEFVASFGVVATLIYLAIQMQLVGVGRSTVPMLTMNLQREFSR